MFDAVCKLGLEGTFLNGSTRFIDPGRQRLG